MNQSQLQGLIIPPKDEGFNTELYLGLLMLVALLGVFAWRWYQKKVKNRALLTAQKALSALQQSYSSAPESSQSTALAIVSLLCQGLGVKRLDQYQAYDSLKWHNFHQKLNVLCYSKKPSKQLSAQSNLEIDSLFQEAKQWLSKQRSKQ